MEAQTSVLSDKGITLGERLGHGSYATVYKAYNRVLRQNGTREVLAIKCIPRSKICINQNAQDNMIREIDILKKLYHPNIVRLIDFLWDKENIYLVLEYCNAGDLSQFLKKRKQQQFSLPEPVTRKFLQQLASAMKYLRQKQVSHMDLKPQNILLSIQPVDQSITLKLGDFGFATRLRYGDKLKSLRGSPLYMAPEILREESYDARVDLWSIGVILYECLYGKAPFAGVNMEQLISQITSDTDDPISIPAKPPVSPCCHQLLIALLKRDPRDRLTFNEFFTHPFVEEKYCPSQDCLDRAFELLSRAEKCDQALQTFKLYCECLDYLICGLQYAKSAKSEELRSVIKQVLVKAENVKQSMNLSNEFSAISLSQSQDEESRLKQLFPDFPNIEAALVLKKFADSLMNRPKDDAENLQTALDKYQLAIESNLSVIAQLKHLDERKPERSAFLKNVTSGWLSRAETLKQCVEMIGQTSATPDSIEEKERQAEISLDEKTRKILQENFCKMQ